jgi:hypothetical protein
MEDTLSKYIRLFAYLLLTALGVIALLALVLFLFKTFFGVVDSLSAFSYAYKLLFLSLPVIVMLSAFIVFLKRVSFHPLAWVRWLSNILSYAVIAAIGYVFVKDLLRFYDAPANMPAAAYGSYDLVFLSIVIGTLFLLGIIQALTLPAEKDWMERGTS